MLDGTGTFVFFVCCSHLPLSKSIGKVDPREATWSSRALRVNRWRTSRSWLGPCPRWSRWPCEISKKHNGHELSFAVGVVQTHWRNLCKLCNTWITRVIGLKDNMLDKSEQQKQVYNIVYFRTADCQTTSETKNLSESRSCIMSPLTLLQVSRCEDEQLVPGSQVWEENSVFSELAKAITSLGVSRR